MQFKKAKEADRIESVLGEGTEISGEISFNNGLRVDGVVKGKARSDSLLVIGASGRMEADAIVRRISVYGEFRGTIRALERVEIHKDGKVFGEIFSPCLIIEAGATFDGRCNMSDEKTADIMTRNDPAQRAAGA
jgi:cytoskeletal protein CcmA (bactofilin family)